MGIPFKLYEGKEVNLPAELTAGGIYFCEDSGNVFIDVDIDGTLTRVPLGKKYVDDQLVDIREFIENQGSGIEIGDEPPTKESANVWINTSDEDEEGVEYLGVVTSINGKGGDVNITASDINAAEKTHAAQHASGGSDPITPAAIGAVKGSWTMHNTISALGLELASATMDTIKAAMVNNSELCLALGSGLPDGLVPNNVYGTLHVIRASYSRSYAFFTALTGTRYFGTWGKSGDAFAGWQQLATTGYAVNKAGDTMTDNLTVQKASGPAVKVKDTTQGRFGEMQYNVNEELLFSNIKDNNNRSLLFLRNESNINSLMQLSRVVGGTWTSYDILHTGNKPSGSYTGNGSSWHPITNVIGNGVIVWSSQGVALVTPNGGIARESGNNTIIGLGGSVCTFSSGDLWVAAQTDANASQIALVNKATVTYTYQVL